MGGGERERGREGEGGNIREMYLLGGSTVSLGSGR